MLSQKKRFIAIPFLLILLIGLVGCSDPKEETGKAPKPPSEVAHTVAATPVEPPPTGPIAIQIPGWLEKEDQEGLQKITGEAAGEREVHWVASGQGNWNIALLSNDVPTDGTSFPWVAEDLHLYVNKVLLARAGVLSIPKTWEEVLAAVDQRGQVEGLTAFFALPGNSPGMFRTISVFTALCGGTSYSHPEEESVCVAVEALGDLQRKGDFVLDHEKGLGVREAMGELAKGKAVMALAWESEGLILNNARTASVASQIKAASPPSFEIHGVRENRQPVREWNWVVNSASDEDAIVVDIAKTLSGWRELDLPFGKFNEASSTEKPSVVKGGFFQLDPPNSHAVRETRRILLEGWNAKKTGLEILQGTQIRYQAIREHDGKQ